MIERVKKYIRENQMLEAGSMIVAGVSGGADSVAMLHILKSLDFPWRRFISTMESGEKKRTEMKPL